MKRSLRQALAERRVRLSDGAIGTMLQAAGLEPGEAPEVWNIRHPERVFDLHLGYVKAGSDMIMTNTFGGNRIKMERAGIGQYVLEANRTAAEIARQAAGDEVLVAGNLGPTGELLEPYGSLTHEDAVRAFAEQAEALARAGVDYILVQTMSDVAEVRAAVEGIRLVGDLPILCTMSFGVGGRTLMGTSPVDAVRAMLELRVEGVGANCGVGPADLEPVLVQMLRAQPGVVIVAQPNAGLPRLEGNNTVYDATPEVMAAYARRYAELGVRDDDRRRM